MNIDLELYRVFYVVAKNKHMTKASEELHISQPAISQSIKKLEDGLGGTLFLRSNKGMELTEEGKMFYEYVKGALELINNAENEFTAFKDLTKGEIKIGCSTTLTKLILINALKEFHKEYPNININITNNLTIVIDPNTIEIIKNTLIIVSIVYFPKIVLTNNTKGFNLTPFSLMTHMLKHFLPIVCPSFNINGIINSTIRNPINIPNVIIKVVLLTIRLCTRNTSSSFIKIWYVSS